MSHFIIKLTTGEFVYGTLDVDKTDKSMIVLQNPLTWHEYDDGEGHGGSALVKFMNGTDEKEVPIAKTAIMSMARMSSTFENFYEAAVAVQQITDEAYEENIQHMTSRMVDLVMDYQDRMQAMATDEIVISHKKTNTTIH